MINSQEMSIPTLMSLELRVRWYPPNLQMRNLSPKLWIRQPCVTHCVRVRARFGIPAFCCCFHCPLCWMWVWPPSSAAAFDGSPSSVCFPAFWGCRPQRWGGETLLGLLLLPWQHRLQCHPNCLYYKHGRPGMWVLARQFPINLFFSD